MGRGLIQTVWVAGTLVASCYAFAAAAAPASAPATATATRIAPQVAGPAASAPGVAKIRTNFTAGEPIDALLTAIAQRYDVLVVKAIPVDATILKDVEMPASADEALDLAQKTLEAQGIGMLRSVSESGHLVAKLTTTQEVKTAELLQSPVTTGSDTSKIDVSKPDREVTHMLPIQHADMIDTLRRTATQDKGVEVSVVGSAAIGYQLILIGPAQRVQHAADSVLKVDGVHDSRTAARAVTLLHLDAAATASALNITFAREANGMRATADVRTNTVIVTGPDNLVPQAVIDLVGADGYIGVRPNPGRGGGVPGMPAAPEDAPPNQ